MELLIGVRRIASVLTNGSSSAGIFETKAAALNTDLHPVSPSIDNLKELVRVERLPAASPLDQIARPARFFPIARRSGSICDIQS